MSVACQTRGDDERQFVREGNKLQRGCAILCALCSASGVAWAIEQPSSSLFFHTPDMRKMCLSTGAQKVSFAMGNYGHEAKKQTILVGTVKWLAHFGSTAGFEASSERQGKDKAKGKETAVGKTNAKENTKGKAKAKGKSQLVLRKVKDGRTKVWGTAKLKSSQVYPVEFALCVARLQWPDLFGGKS